MNGTKKKRSIPKDLCFYLLPELLTEHILPRLPVKTLLIFRSVCKAWCSAIDDPSFVSMHLERFKNNCDKNKLFVIKKGKHDCIESVIVCRQNILTRSVHSLNPRDRYFFRMSCNGLFFFQDVVNGNLKLCNLSIRKILLLPPCPLVAPNRVVKYLFGFKPSSSDYVVYAFLGEGGWPTKRISLAVYTLSDNLWRNGNPKMTMPGWIYVTLFETMLGGKYVYLDGALHWFGNAVNSKKSEWRTHLVSFNFDTEKFSYVELPDSQQGMETQTFRFLFVLGGSLAMLSISSRRSSIWVLKNGSWDLRLLKFSNSVGFDYINKHPHHVVSNYFYVDDGGITLVYEKIAYKIMRDEIKHLSQSLSRVVCLETYVESLVLLKGCQGQIITSF